MTDLLFIRHAETRANAVGRWQGWTDPPLTAAGRAQAASLAYRLARELPSVDAIYTSPLRRALETARIIAAQLDKEPRLVEGLKEIHFGRLEGVSLDEMEERFPDLHARWQDRSDMEFQWPGGEQRGEFFHRAAAACRRILQSHLTPSPARDSPTGKPVVLVAHGGTIRACLADLLRETLGNWWTYGLDNTGITRVRVADEGARLLVLNDTSHLAEDVPQASGD